MACRGPNCLRQQQQQHAAQRPKGPRVVVFNETDPTKIPDKQIDWLLQHYPGFKLIEAALTKHNKRIYSRADFQTANGQRKVVLFDVTSALHNNINTNIQAFQTGTMARFQPGTRSTPTRMQVVI